MKTKLLLPNALIIITLASVLVISACKQKNQKEEAVMAAQVFSTEPMSSSPEYSDAGIQSMDYRDGKFNFSISGSSYALGVQTSDAPAKTCANSDKGQHIHLIIDDKPYEAKYEPQFSYKVADGSHYVMAFLSRSYHESIKSPKAHVLVKAEIKDSGFVKVEPVTAPMLFYSRPKGIYIGKDAQNVMLDFYLSNCNLGNQYKVKAEVAGNSFVLDEWKPVLMKGLPMGEHTMKLSLVDSAGNLVNTPLNPVERKFTLQEEPAK
ncbi:MAG TPA: hypothetical protein PK006_05295 [Saprospiraceae bacterium]|nr:hypothetical protein [Saprospiraceae bacterium]